jgi:uncharacterized protein (DUF58 family)
MVLTPSGRSVLGASAVLYGVAWRLGYPEAAVVALTGALATLMSVLCVLPRAGIEVRRDVLPRKVGRGCAAEGILTVRNTGRTLRAGLRAIDTCADTRVPVVLPALDRGEQQVVRYPLPTERRGLVPVGPLRLVRTDPLGLARRVLAVGEAQTLLVRPNTVDLGVFPAGRAHNPDGPTSDTATGGTVTFHSLREFVLGDDVRRVHWPSTARTGTIMIRQMVDVSMPHTTIVLDARAKSYATGPDRGAAMDWFELAVDTAASVALAAARHSFPVRLHTTAGFSLETSGGRADAGVLLDGLALVETSDSGSLAAELEGVRRSRAGGALITVTGAGAPRGEEGRISVLRGRFDQLLLMRVGPRDAALGSGGDVDEVRVHDVESLVSGWKRVSGR